MHVDNADWHQQVVYVYLFICTCNTMVKEEEVVNLEGGMRGRGRKEREGRNDVVMF